MQETNVCAPASGARSLCAFFLAAAGLFSGAVAQGANQPPSISGTPATWVYVGSLYSFRPTASDPEGKAVSFSVVNKPGWASFNTSTGRLSGTPSTVGLWSSIRIRVTDGVSTRSLP
jgi:hypothetical protein